MANSKEAKAEKILSEAKTKYQESILEAKEKAVQMLEEAKREERKMRQDLQSAQQRLEKRESMFDQKLLEFQDKQTKLQEKIDFFMEIQTTQINKNITNKKDIYIEEAIHVLDDLQSGSAKKEMPTKLKKEKAVKS